MYVEVGLLAYLIDRVFGEFPIKHPVVFMGDYIKWFEDKFYKDSVLNGAILTISLILITLFIIGAISLYIGYMSNRYIEIIFFAIVGSMAISSNMLYKSVKDIIDNPQNIKYLVSRDTKDLSNKDINKASIESYGENLSDGVIAPLIYLSLFGLVGAFVYKAINTLDSMVGYRNDRYEKFGKFSAILDDIVNYIPSRVTAILIGLLFGSQKAIMNFYKFGKKHKSPNAGHPISAIALATNLKLGGDTSYFGKVEKKAYFGDGKEDITKDDILKAISFQLKLDIFIIFMLVLVLWV